MYLFSFKLYVYGATNNKKLLENIWFLTKERILKTLKTKPDLVLNKTDIKIYDINIFLIFIIAFKFAGISDNAIIQEYAKKKIRKENLFFEEDFANNIIYGLMFF